MHTAVTLLVNADPRETSVKKFAMIDGKIEKQDVSTGTWFKTYRPAFHGLAGLYEILSKAEHNQTLIHAIRNDVQSPNDVGSVRATRHNRPATASKPAQVAYFQDVPANVICIDCDNTPVPDGQGWHDVPAMAASVWANIQTQSPFLTNAGCVWKVSGSGGIFETQYAKFHFYILNHDGLLFHDRDAFLKSIPSADASVARVVHRHFIGGRVCEGFNDPIPHDQTCGMIDGDMCLVAATAAPMPKPVSAIAQRFTEQTTEFGAEKLRKACTDMQLIPKGTRHVDALRIIYTIGGWVGGGEIAQIDAYNALRAAVSGFDDPDHHYATIDEKLADGAQEPLEQVTLESQFKGVSHIPAGMTPIAAVNVPAISMPVPLGTIEDRFKTTTADDPNATLMAKELATMPRPKRVEILAKLVPLINPELADGC